MLENIPIDNPNLRQFFVFEHVNPKQLIIKDWEQMYHLQGGGPKEFIKIPTKNQKQWNTSLIPSDDTHAAPLLKKDNWLYFGYSQTPDFFESDLARYNLITKEYEQVGSLKFNYPYYFNYDEKKDLIQIGNNCEGNEEILCAEVLTF